WLWTCDTWARCSLARYGAPADRCRSWLLRTKTNSRSGRPPGHRATARGHRWARRPDGRRATPGSAECRCAHRYPFRAQAEKDRRVRTRPAAGMAWDCAGRSAENHWPRRRAGWPGWPARAPGQDWPWGRQACRLAHRGAPDGPRRGLGIASYGEFLRHAVQAASEKLQWQRVFDRQADRQNAAVSAIGARNHQARGRRAWFMARHRHGAAIQEVDESRVAQYQAVGRVVGVVAGG